jgi:hypothetical protein
MDQVCKMLGSRYAMFYHHAVSVTQLRPQQTLEDSIEIVNNYMRVHGRDLALWELGLQDEAARLVNVNWIYQRLAAEPIKKPILVHCEGSNFVVDCGDTRLMALNLCSSQPLVSVLITVLKHQQHQYQDWIAVTSDLELIQCAGMDPGSTSIYYTSADESSAHAVTWLEIGDVSTAHHLHSLDNKLDMLQRYLDQQSNNFVFSVEWAKQSIDWI